MKNTPQENKKVSISVFSDRPLGAVLISERELSFSQDIDIDLKKFIETLVKEGVPYMEELRLPGRFVSVFKKAFPGDNNFYFELTNVLKRQGYKIAEEHEKIDEELKGLLNFLPDTPAGQKIREEINTNLNQMNFLEKTYIKQVIKEKLEEAIKAAH